MPTRQKPIKNDIAVDSTEVQNLSTEDIQKLVHELRVHQIELEMQNDELRRAQWDLEESRTRYAELYDYAPVGYFTLDQNCRITEINLTGAALFGLERNQMIGYPFVSFVQSDSANTFYVHCRKARETQIKQVCDVKLHHPRIVGFEARLETVAITQPDDGLLWYRTAVSDITERKRAELATGYLSGIVTSSDDAIISKDLNGIITSWNAGAQRLFGYTAEEVIGKPVTLLIPPDHIDEETKILDCIRRGEPVHYYETVRQRKNGSLVDISLTVSPILDTSGRIIGAAKIARDITNRKETETALRETEQRLRLAVQRAPLLFYHQNTSLTYTWMLDPYPGLMMEQIIGKTDEDIFPADEALQLNVLKQNVFDTGIGAREVVQHTLRDQIYFYDLSVEPIKNADGGVIALTCAAVDVTARRLDEELIKSQNDEMEDFLYIIAHDLKSPVVSLQGLLGVMREENGSALDQEGLKMLDFCIEECNRMKNIVLQVREMGRIKQTDVVQEKENLRALIHTVLQRFDKEIKAKKVQIVVDCPDVEIIFAKAQIDQALNNLIDNALKYGASVSAPKLTIQGQVERVVSRIRVTDNGLGIAPVHHKQVFKLFSRLDPQGAIKGTGVGLTSVQTLMRRIKGEVNLQSDVNQGVQITISFPSQTVK